MGKLKLFYGNFVFQPPQIYLAWSKFMIMFYWLSVAVAASGSGFQCQWLSVSLAVSVFGSQCQWLSVSVAVAVSGSGCQWQWLSVAVAVSVSGFYWNCKHKHKHKHNLLYRTPVQHSNQIHMIHEIHILLNLSYIFTHRLQAERLIAYSKPTAFYSVVVHVLSK